MRVKTFDQADKGRVYRFKCKCGTKCDGTLTVKGKISCWNCFEIATKDVIETQKERFGSPSYMRKGVGERIKIEQFDL